MLLSFTQDEVMWLLERMDNEDFGGDVEGYEIDPYALTKKLAEPFVEICDCLFSSKDNLADDHEFAVGLESAELWVLKEKVSMFDKTPDGKKLGMKLLYKIYSAILKAESDDDFLDRVTSGFDHKKDYDDGVELVHA